MRFLTSLLLTGSLLAGCAGGDDDDAGEDAVLLAVLPYTGKWESKGPMHENAVRMALEDLIAAGAQEATGRRFTVISVNSGDGVDVVSQAIDDVLEGPDGDKVVGMISSTGDAHKGAVLAAVEHSIPHFETSNGARDDEFIDWANYTDEELSYLLSARPLCLYEAIYSADFIHAQHAGKKVALVRGDDVHDKMHTAVIRERLRELGFTGEVIESNDPSLAGEANVENRQDFYVSYDALAVGGIEAELQAIQTAHQPDLIFFHLQGDAPNLRMLQDLNRIGFGGVIVTCGMARTDGLIDPNSNGLISDYLVGDDASLTGSRFHFVMRGAIPSPRLDAFKAEYTERYDLTPDTFTPAVYDATMLWGLGVIAGVNDRAAVLAGIYDASRDGTEVSRDDLASLVQLAASGEDVDYQGASAPMDIREDRSILGRYFVERVTNSGGGAYAYSALSDPAPVEF